MSRYIVPDTDLLAAALFKEKEWVSHQSREDFANPIYRAIIDMEVEAISPSVAHYEFFNVCRKKMNAAIAAAKNLRAASIQEANKAIQIYFGLPIIWDDRPVELIRSDVWNLHMNHQIGTGDAFFLEIAMKWDAEIWTMDKAFSTRAKQIYNKVFFVFEDSF